MSIHSRYSTAMSPPTSRGARRVSASAGSTSRPRTRPGPAAGSGRAGAAAGPATAAGRAPCRPTRGTGSRREVGAGRRRGSSRRPAEDRDARLRHRPVQPPLEARHGVGRRRLGGDDAGGDPADDLGLGELPGRAAAGEQGAAPDHPHALPRLVLRVQPGVRLRELREQLGVGGSNAPRLPLDLGAVQPDVRPVQPGPDPAASGVSASSRRTTTAPSRLCVVENIRSGPNGKCVVLADERVPASSRPDDDAGDAVAPPTGPGRQARGGLGGGRGAHAHSPPGPGGRAAGPRSPTRAVPGQGQRDVQELAGRGAAARASRCR